MFEVVKQLPFDEIKTLYKEGGIEVRILRPSKLSARFKDYDINKNFQIWLKDGNRTFRPNHLRVFIDLNLRVRSRPDLKKDMLLAFDNIYYGSDPEIELKKLAKERFEHSLNHIIITGYLSQLFLIEQEYCYHKESKFDPANLFFQGWVREFIDNPKEIDNLCMSVSNRQPPIVNYTYKENKKHKSFDKNLNSIWYLKK